MQRLLLVRIGKRDIYNGSLIRDEKPREQWFRICKRIGFLNAKAAYKAGE
jgi:hypothetical protein